MQSLIPQFLHYLFVLIAAFLFYTTIFIYEDDSRRVQNKLADIYISIEIFKEKYSTIRALMIKANEILLQFFKNYLDDGKLTFKFIGVSGFIIICVFFYLKLLTEERFSGDTYELILNRPQYIIYFLFSILLTFLFSNRLNQKFPIYFTMVIIFIIYNAYSSHLESFADIMENIGAFICCFIGPLICLKINIVITKWGLNSLLNKRSYYAIVSSLITNVFVIGIILMGTLFVFNLFIKNFYMGLGFFVFLCFAFSLFLIANVTFAIIFLAIIGNRLLFPIISEPIRALYEHNLITKKKTLAAIGFLFLIFAYPQLAETPILKAIKELYK